MRYFKFLAIIFFAAILSFSACDGDGTDKASNTADNITDAVISGFVTPLTGIAPQSVLTLAAGDNTYTVTTLTWNTEAENFAEETVYTASVVLTSAEGYKFTAITPTVNTGTPGEVTVDGGDVSGNTLAFDVIFPATLPASGIEIGDNCGGGIVVYILDEGDTGYDASVQHGLIAATEDQSDGIIWALSDYQSTSVPGGTGLAFGTGSANTDNIISQNGSGSGYAAGLARACNNGGYTDWFLPSKIELDVLYNNKDLIGIDTGGGDYYYWSSSEGSYWSAWILYFNSNFHQTWGKNETLRVRAVRVF